MKEKIFITILSLALFGSILFISLSNSSITKKIVKEEEKIEQLEKEVGSIKKIKPKKSEVKEELNSAKEFGLELVNAQNVLSSFGEELDETLTEDEVSNRKEASEKYKKLVETDQYFLWKKNKDWKLTFESLSSYREDIIPVLFTMTNSKGELMGVVFSNFDSVSKKFKEVDVKYTPIGKKEFEIN